MKSRILLLFIVTTVIINATWWFPLHGLVDFLLEYNRIYIILLMNLVGALLTWCIYLISRAKKHSLSKKESILSFASILIGAYSFFICLILLAGFNYTINIVGILQVKNTENTVVSTKNRPPLSREPNFLGILILSKFSNLPHPQTTYGGSGGYEGFSLVTTYENGKVLGHTGMYDESLKSTMFELGIEDACNGKLIKTHFIVRTFGRNPSAKTNFDSVDNLTEKINEQLQRVDRSKINC